MNGMAGRLEQLILGIFDCSIKKSEVIYQVSIVSFQMVISNMADMLQVELCTDKVNLGLADRKAIFLKKNFRG